MLRDTLITRKEKKELVVASKEILPGITLCTIIGHIPIKP